MATVADLTCRAVGCRARILWTEVFCERHTAMLQSDVKTAIGKLFRPGKKPSKAFAVVLKIALEEVLYCQTEGHRAPRDSLFEW